MSLNASEVALKLLGSNGDPSGAYLQFLKEITSHLESIEAGVNYDNLMPTAGNESGQARLLQAAKLIMENPRKTRREDTQILRNVLGSTYPNPYIDKLMEIAAQAITMIDPAAGDWHAQDFVMGRYRPSSWQRDESFQSFCSRSIPVGNDEAIIAAKAALDVKSSLRARKLKKHLGVQFYATGNLAEHLLLEHRHGKTRLYVFHYTGYLKARLEQTMLLKLPVDCAIGDCLEQ